MFSYVALAQSHRALAFFVGNGWKQMGHAYIFGGPGLLSTSPRIICWIYRKLMIILIFQNQFQKCSAMLIKITNIQEIKNITYYLLLLCIVGNGSISFAACTWKILWQQTQQHCHAPHREQGVWFLHLIYISHHYILFYNSISFSISVKIFTYAVTHIVNSL